MIHPDFKFLRAVFLMIGGLVGVGVFGLPFAFAQSGIALGLLELLLIGGVLMIVQFMYAELAVQTEGSHRLVGFVEYFLGKNWSRVSLLAMCASVWGAMLAYMIIGGTFLSYLLSPVLGGSVMWYSVAVWAVAAVLVRGGLRFASKLEVFVIIALAFLFLFMMVVSVPYIRPAHFTAVNPSQWFLPYGIILFALSSTGIVPEMREVLGVRAKKQLGKAVLVGMSSVIFLYALFSLAVVGVRGAETTRMAFDGLIPVFGGSFGVITAVLGLVTILSIFMMVGISLQNMLKFDLDRTRFQSYVLTVSVPLLLFLSGVREFLSLIGFLGAVFGGILGILIVRCYMKLKHEPLCKERHCLDVPNSVSVLAILFFLLGIILSLRQFLLY